MAEYINAEKPDIEKLQEKQTDLQKMQGLKKGIDGGFAEW